jgi:integrase
MTRRNLTDFFAVRLDTVQATTVSIDFRVIRVFAKWLVIESELTTNPMENIKGPRQTAKPVPVLTDDQIKRLLAACSGRDQRSLRDTAILRLAIDTGCRRGELSTLSIRDLDLDENLARVTGKTGTRIVPFRATTAIALDRWLRQRPKSVGDSVNSGDSVFRLTPSGLAQAFKERARQAEVDAHIHQLRHTFAANWLAAGGQEGDLLQLGGWTSRVMLDRYGASTRAQRSIEAYRRLSTE